MLPLGQSSMPRQALTQVPPGWLKSHQYPRPQLPLVHARPMGPPPSVPPAGSSLAVQWTRATSRAGIVSRRARSMAPVCRRVRSIARPIHVAPSVDKVRGALEHQNPAPTAPSPAGARRRGRRPPLLASLVQGGGLGCCAPRGFQRFKNASEDVEETLRRCLARQEAAR